MARVSDYQVRNFLRNISSYTLNRAFPGAQRNSTSRDAHAISAESLDFYQSVNQINIGDRPMSGISQVGE